MFYRALSAILGLGLLASAACAERSLTLNPQDIKGNYITGYAKCQIDFDTGEEAAIYLASLNEELRKTYQDLEGIGINYRSEITPYVATFRNERGFLELIELQVNFDRAINHIICGDS